MVRIDLSFLHLKCFYLLVIICIIGLLWVSFNVLQSTKDDQFGNVSAEELGHAPVNPVNEISPRVEQNAFPNEGTFKVKTIPQLPGNNVISMSLYGSQLRYTAGVIRNAELARVNFPGWTLRIYTETPSEKPHFGAVPETVLSQLRALGADIHFIDPRNESVPPMMWRFLVADDTRVDRFIVRDCDSRLTERDAAAVDEWVKSGRPFHCVRDHPSHRKYAVSGGMWGAKPKAMFDLLNRTCREMMPGFNNTYMEDMNFLNHVVWPKVQHQAYCSDSVSCTKYPNSFPFPIPRTGAGFVGGAYNEHDVLNPGSVAKIRFLGENPNCLPGKNVTYYDIDSTKVFRPL